MSSAGVVSTGGGRKPSSSRTGGLSSNPALHFPLAAMAVILIIFTLTSQNQSSSSPSTRGTGNQGAAITRAENLRIMKSGHDEPPTEGAEETDKPTISILRAVPPKRKQETLQVEVKTDIPHDREIRNEQTGQQDSHSAEVFSKDVGFLERLDHNLKRRNIKLPEECNTDKHRKVGLFGNRPVGTYLCSYFPEAPKRGDTCTLSCPSGVTCSIKEKASHGELATGNIIVNHHGPVPKKQQDKPYQIRLYYTGESNATEPKKVKLWPQYDQVVSFHASQRFHFTWTARFKKDFDKIAAGTAPSKYFDVQMTPPKWDNRINAIAVFISRCQKGWRDGFVRELKKHFEIRSFGKCVHTHDAESLHPDCPHHRKDRYSQKLCVLSKYRFALSMDNSREEDYVTEKVYHGLLGGGLALYDGAPNIHNYIPTMQSVIHLKKFWPELENFRTASTDERKLGFQRLLAYLHAVSPVAEIGQVIQPKMAVGGDLQEVGGGDGTTGVAMEDHFEWRTNPSSWSKGFNANLKYPEPTCDLCTMAAVKKCKFDLEGALDVKGL